MEPTEITAGRLHLRPFTPAESEAVYLACQDPEIQRWTTVPVPYHRSHAEQYVAAQSLDGWLAGTGHAFAVLDGGIYYIDRPSANVGLLFVDQPSGETRLQYFDFATGKTTTVVQNLGNIFLGLTASKDGRTILYSRVDSSVDELMLAEDFR